MINKIDYKGKYFILQDKDYPEDDMDFIVGEINKKEVLDPDFIEVHKANCDYYGIPCYIGKDEELRKAYNNG